MSNVQWTILTLDRATNETDFRRTCANKLRGPYIIHFFMEDREIAVILLRDVDAVLGIADVVDRRIGEYYAGQRAEFVLERHTNARPS